MYGAFPKDNQAGSRCNPVRNPQWAYMRSCRPVTPAEDFQRRSLFVFNVPFAAVTQAEQAIFVLHGDQCADRGQGGSGTVKRSRCFQSALLIHHHGC